MNKLLQNRTSLFGKVGSFWHQQTDKNNPNGTDLARALARLQDDTGVWASTLAGMDRALGAKNVLLSNFDLTFDRQDVTILSIDLQERAITQAKDATSGDVYISIALKEQYEVSTHTILALEDESGQLTIELGDYLLFPTESEFGITFTFEEARPKYLVPIPRGIEPVCIRGKDKDLVSGISFRAANGFLVFEEDPLSLFEDSYMTVRSGWKTNESLNKYTLKLDNVLTSGRWVAEYLRNSHSAAAMERALAEVAGIPVLDADSVLTRIIRGGNGDLIYEFEDYSVRVPYYIEHTELTPGEQHLAGTIIGDHVNIHTAPSNGDRWHSGLDWSEGLSLDGLCPFLDLVVPNRFILFDSVNSTGGNYHYRPHIDGPTETVSRYWGFLEEGEKNTGNYLQDAFDAPYPNDKYAHALDFWFDNLLGDKAMIFDLKTEDLGSNAHNNVLAFIKRELPIGVVPIIRDARLFTNLI